MENKQDLCRAVMLSISVWAEVKWFLVYMGLLLSWSLGSPSVLVYGLE